MKQMLALTPGTVNEPLFSIINQGKLGPLTDSMARKHLKLIATHLHISNLTFQMLRKGGTTWAFQHGVDLQAIVAHGIPKLSGDT